MPACGSALTARSTLASCHTPLTVNSIAAQQPGGLWDEGSVIHQVWPVTAVPEPSQCDECSTLQQLPSSGFAAGGLLEIANTAHTVSVQCHQQAHTRTILILQQQWAANLQSRALADSMEQVQQPLHNSGQHRQLLAPPQLQQQQQPLHDPPSWLQQLLAANAGVPLRELTQLDLSLEQLPGLHGLAALCPRLMNVAVNMNGLSSLKGLQGCSALVHLSAQVSDPTGALAEMGFCVRE